MEEPQEKAYDPGQATIFERVKGLGLPLGQYIVVGGALEAHGIRDANDIDLIVTHELFDRLLEEGWPEYPLQPGDVGEDGSKRKVSKDNVDVMTEFSWKDVTIARTPDLIAGAEFIQGVPFIPLRLLLQWKEISEREKDATDAQLIRRYLGEGGA